ncbi:MAG: dTMP kinase [Proteobacteria bacterium]|nr:dTMP kinase [Pseudomonadota bacterium]
MFVVFEGIDGSGKTTVSNRVAKALRRLGIDVEHIREGGIFSSALVSRMREFGKDTRNLAMTPLAELLFYCARDAQLVDECVRPALDRGALVIGDRYLYSHLVLAESGRGLPGEQVRPIVDAVAGGLWPDLVVLMDVDPFVARARRKAAKLVRKANPQPPRQKTTTGGSRKGLAGVGMQHRLRDGYLALAEVDTERWVIVNNSDPRRPGNKLKTIVARIADVIAELWHAKKSRRQPEHTARPAGNWLVRPHPRPIITPSTLHAGRDLFYSAVRARAVREVDVASYFLAGLDDERAYRLRQQWVEKAPHTVAHGLRGLADEKAWRLREVLREDAPYHVARSLQGPALDGERAAAMREEMAESQPGAILATLAGNDSESAWQLRERFAQLNQQYDDVVGLGQVVASLERIDSERAWALRDRYAEQLVRRGDGDVRLVEFLVKSLCGLDTPQAWAIRERFLQLVPIPVLRSIVELDTERAWQLRERHIHRAPKIILRTIDGSSHPRAHALRAAQLRWVKEALDSLGGLDDTESWSLRAQGREIWPSTTVKSLGPLGLSGRGLDLALDTLARYSDNISLLKHITRLAIRADRSARARADQPAEKTADSVEHSAEIADVSEFAEIGEGRGHAS